VSQPSAPWGFECGIERRGSGGVTVRAVGEIDISTVGRLRECLASARQTATTIAVDLRGVTFMDSSGVHALVDETAEAMFSGVRIDLEVTPAIDRLIRLARCEDSFAAWNLSPVPTGVSPRRSATAGA
jgi:anti-anti-sigma factor